MFIIDDIFCVIKIACLGTVKHCSELIRQTADFNFLRLDQPYFPLSELPVFMGLAKRVMKIKYVLGFLCHHHICSVKLDNLAIERPETTLGSRITSLPISLLNPISQWVH